MNQLSIDEQKDPGILSHGIDFGHTQHELPMDFVGRVADHQVLGCGLEVTQALLQHAGVVQRPPSTVTKRLRSDVHCYLSGVGGRTSHLDLKLQVRGVAVAHRIPGLLQYFDDQRPDGAQL